MYNVLVGKIGAVLHDRKGISAMEYAILAAVILTAVGTALTGLSTEIATLFTTVIGKIQAIVT